MSDTDQTVTVKIETPETSSPEDNNSTEESVTETVAAAQAAVALAQTVAANAEQQAAEEIRETKEDWEQRWNVLNNRVTEALAKLETLFQQVTSLTSRQIATEAEVEEVAETVEAEEILTPPPHTEEKQTEHPDKSEEENPAETTPIIPEKVKRVFRL